MLVLRPSAGYMKQVHNVHVTNDKNTSKKVERVAFMAFRNDLAAYLEKLAKGEELQIMNARRGKLIVSLVKSGGKWIEKPQFIEVFLSPSVSILAFAKILSDTDGIGRVGYEKLRVMPMTARFPAFTESCS